MKILLDSNFSIYPLCIICQNKPFTIYAIMVKVSFQRFLSDILIYLEIFAPHCVNPYEGIHRQIPHFICDNKISFDLHALLSLDVNCYRIELW